jgi:hypothetical protein
MKNAECRMGNGELKSELRIKNQEKNEELGMKN